MYPIHSLRSRHGNSIKVWLLWKWHLRSSQIDINQEIEKMEFSQPEWERGLTFECLGNSNRSICRLFEPILFWNFPNFWLSYWGAHSYYPRGLILRKENSSNFKYGWDRGVSVPGEFKPDHLITGFWANFALKFFLLLIFILWSPFPFFPRNMHWHKVASANSYPAHPCARIWLRRELKCSQGRGGMRRLIALLCQRAQRPSTDAQKSPNLQSGMESLLLYNGQWEGKRQRNLDIQGEFPCCLCHAS